MSWAARLEPEPALAIIQRAQFEWVDLTVDAIAAKQVSGELLNRWGLKPSGLLWCGSAGGDAVAPVAAYARTLGLDSVIMVGAADRKVSLVDEAETIAGTLDRMGGLAVELINRCGSRLEQVEDFRELFVRLNDPRVRVAIDTLECHRASVDPRAAIDALSDRLVRLVVRDGIADRQVPLGTGEVNIRSVLAHARRAGSLMWLVIDPPVFSAVNAAEELAEEKRRLEKLLLEI